METVKLPFYVRLMCVLISIICIGFIFFIGKDILTSILLAFLFSVLLLPLFTLLNIKLRFPHFLASIVTVIIFVLIIIGILTFISYQISDIANDFSVIKKNAISVFNDFQKITEKAVLNAGVLRVSMVLSFLSKLLIKIGAGILVVFCTLTLI